MLCQKCGKNVSGTEKFCGYCGSPIEKMASVVGTPWIQTTPGTQKQESWVQTTPGTQNQEAWMQATPVAPKQEPWMQPGYDASLGKIEPKETKSKSLTKDAMNEKLQKGAIKVLGFWKRYKVRLGLEEPEEAENVYERGMKIVPDCISADEGEIPIRQYVVAKLRTLHKLNWAEGRLQITNKRVIFRAPGHALMGRTVLQHEFAIDEIAGVEARKEPKFSFGALWLALCACVLAAQITTETILPIYRRVGVLGDILSFLALFSGCAPLFLIHKKFLLKVFSVGASVGAVNMMANCSEYLSDFAKIMVTPVSIIWLIACILYCFRQNLVLTIKTKGATGAVEIRRKRKVGLLKRLAGEQTPATEEYTGFSDVFPMQNTEQAIREAGAVISDIQKLGDYGIEKWKE